VFFVFVRVINFILVPLNNLCVSSMRCSVFLWSSVVFFLCKVVFYVVRIGIIYNTCVSSLDKYSVRLVFFLV